MDLPRSPSSLPFLTHSISACFPEGRTISAVLHANKYELPLYSALVNLLSSSDLPPFRWLATSILSERYFTFTADRTAFWWLQNNFIKSSQCTLSSTSWWIVKTITFTSSLRSRDNCLVNALRPGSID